MAKFGPVGVSNTITLTSASQTFALGTLAAVNPAIRLIALNSLQQAWFVRFGASGAVTVSEANGMRVIPAGQDAPAIIPVPAGSTHVAILADGADGDAQLSYGGFDEGEFGPAGDSQIITVTQATQTVAIGTVAAAQPALRLVSAVASINDLRIKLGNGAVTASDADAMRVSPGSVENPTIVPITAGQTHIAIFSEGIGGAVTLTPGGLNFGSPPLAPSSIIFTNAERVLGRSGPGGGPGQELTASQVLDFLGTEAQGQIIYRGASTWDLLAPGSAGMFLQMGVSAPQWAYPGLNLLATGSVSNVATVPIVLTAFTAFRAIEISYRFIPATDGANLLLRTSTNGGSSYDSGASDYDWATLEVVAVGGGASSDNGDDSDSSIQLTFNNIGSASSEGITGRLEIIDQTNTALFTKVRNHGSFMDSNSSGGGTRTNILTSGGTRRAAADVDAVQFRMSTGNITGTYTVYGYA